MTIPPVRAMSRMGGVANSSARVGAPAYACPRPGNIRDRNAAVKGDLARGRASCGFCIARRILGLVLGPFRSIPEARSPRPVFAPSPELHVPILHLEARSGRPGTRVARDVA